MSAHIMVHSLQVITDRFASPEPKYCGKTEESGARYCGGTWRAMQEKLPYIRDMGFDAIWLSPIPLNRPGSYHGYAATDIYQVNPHFGTAQDLKDLVTAAHNLSMWVMADVVLNHMADGCDISSLCPFNDSSHFHGCDYCHPVCHGECCSCDMDDGGWDDTSCQYNNMMSVQTCQLSGLNDLNQDNLWVQRQLVEWLHCTIEAFDFDGLRLDAVKHVGLGFWQHLMTTTPLFALGEVLDGHTCFLKHYQDAGVPGLLSYPMYYTLNQTFGNPGFQQNSVTLLGDRLAEYQSHGVHTHLWGNFLDNHDQKRFMSCFVNTPEEQFGAVLLKSALTWVFMSEGIPILYYGTEQLYAGGIDPANREPLWYSKYSNQSAVYLHIQRLNMARKRARVWEYDLRPWWPHGDDPTSASHHQQGLAAGSVYAFTRGQTLVVLTNKPFADQPMQLTFQVHAIPPHVRLCNMLHDSGNGVDCIVTDSAQHVTVVLTGESKVYVMEPQMQQL